MIFNEALILLEDKCIEINNKTLYQLGLPAPTLNNFNIYDKEILRERQYNVVQLRAYVEKQKKISTRDQKKAYDTIIMQHVDNNIGGIIFLDAPGGTGKTLLISLILAEISARNKIAVAVASSVIASTLLDGGRTAHSALKLPLNMNQTEIPTCNIGRN